MGWLPVVLAILAAFLTFRSGPQVVFWLAVFAAIGSLWSWGVMHNYAIEAAKFRRNFLGGFYDITPAEANTVPNWLAVINVLFAVAAAGCLVVALVTRLL